jgi:Uma2 family endonuclease
MYTDHLIIQIKNIIMGIPKKEETEKYYTIEEYLEIQESSEEKLEFRNGEIVAMAGGTGNHSLISTSITTALDNAIDNSGKNCMVFNSDIKVKIDNYNCFVFPDSSVVCGDVEYDNENETVLKNPILLIEVLSKTSKGYDKGEKFEYYRSLPSFKEYMIIYQTMPKVQTWYKEANDLWRIGNAEGLEAVIPLHSIGIEVALKDIYKRIRNFPEGVTDFY